MRSSEPLKDRANGRWDGILSSIGVPSKALRNRHGPCPMPGCGGKDRFRFDNKAGNGTWICSQCGAGDGIEFVKRFLGVDFKGAAIEIEKHIGAVPVATINGKQRLVDDQQRDKMKALWKQGVPVTADDLAGRYLVSRGIHVIPDSLRFIADARYQDDRGKPSWHPVMLAKVDPCDRAIAEGERAALHRTYLDKTAGKADVPSPRKMMGPMPAGAAVRLMPAAAQMGVAEGIETALSASIIYGMPVWATLTEGLLAEWAPPDIVSTLWIFGDNDVSLVGQAAAYALGKRMRAKGLDVIVELPPRAGQDWNDVLKAQGRAGI